LMSQFTCVGVVDMLLLWLLVSFIEIAV